MKRSDMMKLVNFALEDISSAEGQIGNGRQEDNALVFAQIAQAKLLAVIASNLIELNKREQDKYINNPGA